MPMTDPALIADYVADRVFPPTAAEAAERACAHPDCDGWIMHAARPVQVSTAGTGMWQGQCYICDWHTDTFGSEGSAKTNAQAHGSSEHCDGRCASWDDEVAV
jgi:hypothetical protein